MGAPVTVEELEIVIRAKVGEALANMQQVINRMEKLINQQIPQLQPKLDAAMQKADRVIDRDADKIIASIDRLADAQTDLNKRLEQTADRYDEALEGAREFLGGVIQGMSEEMAKVSNKTKDADNRTESFGKRVKKVTGEAGKSYKWLTSQIRGMVVGMVFYRALDLLTTSLKEGTAEMAKFSVEFNQTMSSYKSSFEYLQNAIGGAVVPMLERAEPLVTKLVDGFASIANYIGMFIAAINGQTTYNKAIKTTADYLEDTADAAKEVQRTIAGFDEVNIIGNQDEEEEEPKFEEVAVPKWMTAFGNMLSRIPTLDIYNKITSAAKLAADVVGKLVNAIKGLFADEDLSAAADKLFDAFPKIADKLRSLNFSALKESFASIDFSGIQKAFASIDFSGLIGSFADLWESIRPFGEKVGEGLLWFYETVISPLAKWALENGIPMAISFIADAIDNWRARIETLKPVATWLWENLLVPLGNWTAETLIETLKMVRDLFEKIGDWVSSRKEDFAELAEKVGTLTQEYWELLEPMRDSVWDMFKDTVSWLIEQLPPLIDQFIRTADSVLTCLSAITSLLDKLGIFDSFIEHIQNGMKSTSDFIQGIVEFIVEQFQFMLESVRGGAQLLEGIITLDLKKSLDAMIDNSRTAVNGLISVVNLFITAINGLLDSMLYGINGAIIGLNNALNVVGIDHSFKTIDLNIPKIPFLSEKSSASASASSTKNNSGIGNEELRNIWQYLTPAASGAVAYTPTPLLTGEYPGARTNPEITAPQSMMYDTVIAANGELVSALYGMIREVISAIEDNAGGDFYIDGRRVTETVINGIKAEKRRTGKSPI